MVVVRKPDNDKKQVKNQRQNEDQNASLSKVEQTSPKKSSSGSAAGSDMLVWLKGVTLTPLAPAASEDSVGKLWNQTLKSKDALRLINDECRQRKRKLEEDARGKNSVASGLSSENSNGLCVNKLEFGGRQSHSLSCLSNKTVSSKCFDPQTALNSCSSGSILTSDSCSQLMKLLSNNPNASDNASDQGLHNKDITSLTDSEELVCGLNQLSPENLTVQDLPLADSNDLISSSHSSSSEEKIEQADRLKIQQAERLCTTESDGEYLPRPVIPIGPKFQAKVPEQTGPVNKGKLYGSDDDSESLKWLGTKSWPIENRSRKRDMTEIGRGRPESCSCVSSGSTNCIKCHIHSARLALQSDLGPAFLSWKFDEMGEVVSKTWTVREQCMFESLVNENLLSNGMAFWEHALELFPSKSKKSILSYYYNVFNPTRMSQLTRSFHDQVDSDDDQADNNDGVMLKKMKR